MSDTPGDPDIEDDRDVDVSTACVCSLHQCGQLENLDRSLTAKHPGSTGPRGDV